MGIIQVSKQWLTKISDGNTKLGNIPSVSLPPIVTCINNAPCTDNCYAVRYYRIRPAVREAYQYNYSLLTDNREAYFDGIYQYLIIKRPKRFRWHVAGDIIDQDYFERMLYVIRRTPTTRHLCYTKNYKLRIGILPDNFRIWFSMWPGWNPPVIPKIPKAWMQDGTETRIPDKHYVCPMDCRKCAYCWYGYHDVVFHKH